MAPLNIGEQIKAYARAHKSELEQLEQNEGRSFSKLDIANIMVKAGIITDADVQSLTLNTKDHTIWSSGYLESDDVNYDENIYATLGIKINPKKAEEMAQKTQLPITRTQQAAYDMFKSNLENAQSAFDAQMEYDGIFEDMWDSMKRIWGDNYADAVRRDLAEVKSQQDRLEVAMWNQVRFNEEWEDIHGVPFNEQNLRNFVEYQNSFAVAYIANAVQENFADNFKALLSNHGLQEEAKIQDGPIMHTGMSLTTARITSKEQVYKRDFGNLAKLFDDVIYANTRTEAENKRLETINGSINMFLEQRKQHEKGSVMYDMLTSTISSLYKEKMYLESKDGSFKTNLQQNIEQLKSDIQKNTEELAALKESIDKLPQEDSGRSEKQKEYDSKQQTIKDNQTAL